jgi:hypothetical protein
VRRRHVILLYLWTDQPRMRKHFRDVARVQGRKFRETRRTAFYNNRRRIEPQE